MKKNCFNVSETRSNFLQFARKRYPRFLTGYEKKKKNELRIVNVEALHLRIVRRVILLFKVTSA